MDGTSSKNTSVYKILKVASVLTILLTSVIYYSLSFRQKSTSWLIPANYSSISAIRHLSYTGTLDTFKNKDNIGETHDRPTTKNSLSRIGASMNKIEVSNLTVTVRAGEQGDETSTNSNHILDDIIVNFEIPAFVRSHIPAVKCDSQKYLVYKCFSVCGGLGDREKGIATTFLLALLTNRTFLIDMPKPCEIRTLLRPNLYDWQKCGAYLSNKTTKRLSFMNRASLENLRRLQLETLTEDVVYIQTNIMAVEELRKHPSVKTQIPWLHNGTLETVLGYIFGVLFRVNENIHRRVLNMMENEVNKSTLICTHIRYGRNPSNPNDNKLRHGVPNVDKIFDFLSKFANSSKYTIYIATDSNDVKKYARTRFTNLLTDPGKIMHVDRSRGQNVDGCVGFETVIREQYILSRCDTLILTRSNFGAMSAYMRGHSRDLYLYHKQTDSVLKVNMSMINNMYKFV